MIKRLRLALLAGAGLSLASTFALASTLFLAGCGEYWQAATYPASGQLTINGRPAAARASIRSSSHWRCGSSRK